MKDVCVLTEEEGEGLAKSELWTEKVLCGLRILIHQCQMPREGFKNPGSFADVSYECSRWTTKWLDDPTGAPPRGLRHT